MLPLVKHHALYFEFLFISMVMSPAVGSFDTVDEDVCENEDAVLTWQITSAFNVESKVLYKEETLVASWPKGYKLIIYPPYENRLLQIGESAIKIKNVTKSDSGSYKLILSLKSMTNTSEAVVDLHVIVSPTDNCIVTITHEEDTLWAKVPQEECGIPSLIPYWRNVTQKLVSNNTSVLQPEPRHQPRTYTACAVGKTLKCFMGSPDKLCANSTLDALHSHNGSSSVSVLWILVPILIIAALVIGGIWKLVYIRKKRYTSRESRAMVYNPEEETPLTSAAELTVKITTVEIQVNSVLTKQQEIFPMQQKQGSNDSKENDEELNNGMIELEHRLDTFKNWPSNNQMKPNDLAKAGFFYQGDRDSVICFSCGGKIDKWAPNDNAWEEHEEKYPSCEYVKSHKMAGLSVVRSDETEGIQDIQFSENNTQEEQHISNKRDDKLPEERQIVCRTCHKKTACVIMLPCGHMIACFPCAKSLDKCTQCQEKVLSTVRAFGAERQ